MKLDNENIGGHCTSLQWAKKWRHLAYFQTPPANCLLSGPNAAEYCNSEKHLLSTWLLYTCATFREFWHTNPWDPRAILLFLKTNRFWHVLFPFARWQHDYAQMALCIRRTLRRHVTIGFVYSADADDWYTNGHFCCFGCLLTVFDNWYTVGTVLVDLWRLVHQWFRVFFDDWYSVPFVKNSQKQSKDSQTAKMAIGVPIVTCLHRVRRIHKVRVRVRRMHKAVCVYRYSCPNLYHRNSLFVYV